MLDEARFKRCDFVNLSTDSIESYKGRGVSQCHKDLTEARMTFPDREFAATTNDLKKR
jgi:hypothetical protein